MDIKTLHGDGSHLVVDGFECERNLDSIDSVKDFLNKIVIEIGMKKLNEPVVLRHESENKKERGVTGFVIIAESHISVHTYPEKNFLSFDMFSCKEFDVKKAVEFVKQSFGVKRIEKQIIPRGYRQDIDEDSVEKIKGLDIGKAGNVKDLVKQMKNIGFQATHLSKAVDIIKNMKKENAFVFLTFTSNMVSSGLRELFAELVKRKFVDVIITSIGSVEEDMIKSKKDFLLGDFNADDVQLHKKGINRIGNIFVPDDRYMFLEEKLMPFFSEMLKTQKIRNKMLSPREIIYELGKLIDDEKSFLYWASKNNIPVFCPAPTDGAFGLQLYFFKQKNDEFGIDVSADMKELANLTLNADKTGGIILGGGFAKHHAIGVNILRGGLDYAVYVSTATQYDGSLSGARTNEAISWSKLKEDSNSVFVEGDATIIFPLIALSVLEND